MTPDIDNGVDTLSHKFNKHKVPGEKPISQMRHGKGSFNKFKGSKAKPFQKGK